MTSLSNVTQTIEQIGRVQEGLLHLRHEVGTSNPDLFRVLCEGPLDMLRDLHRDLEQQLELTPSLAPEADVWLRLDGPALRNHVAPVSVLVAILDAFRKGVTAVAELLQNSRLSTRPTASIKSATDLQLLVLAPGSLQIALGLPERTADPDEEAHGALGEHALLRLLEVAAWAASDEPLQSLEALLPDPLTRRTFLTSVRGVVPRPRGGLDLVEIRGRLAPGGSTARICLRRETNARVEQAIDSAVAEKVAEHEGYLREIDLDQMSFKLRNVDEIGEVRCSFEPELLPSAVHALDRRVRVIGVQRTGAARRGRPPIEVVRLEVLEDP